MTKTKVVKPTKRPRRPYRLFEVTYALCGYCYAVRGWLTDLAAFSAPSAHSCPMCHKHGSRRTRPKTSVIYNASVQQVSLM